MSQKIYLDYAAATPLNPQVLEAMQQFYSEQFYNPSATYSAALEVRKSLETSRAKVAHWLGARPSDIIFTAGGTEANNLAIQGVMEQYPDGNIVVSSIEHESVLAPASAYDVRHVAVGVDGRIDLQDLVSKINDQTVLVSIMYANNEIGTVQPIREISQIIATKRREREVGKPLYLHTDACQAANYLDMHVARLGVDLMTINGGKIYGPKQSGCLYVKAGTKLKASINGGGQERNLRSGTENIAGSVGFCEAFDVVQMERATETKRLVDLQQIFIKLLTENMPTVVVNGSTKYRLPNNIHITIPDHDNERLLIQLDEAGVMAAAGSACSASNEEPSHVLAAIGANEADAQASLRFTMGRDTSETSIKETVKILGKLVNI